MTKTFTQNDVIRYAYGEINSPSERKNIETAIVSNTILSDFYIEVVAIKRSLSKVIKEPSQSSLNKILEFSRTYTMPSVSN